jgi:hypothetical protein
MEAKPIVHVPDDVHLTYDGMHDYIKHEESTAPSILTPIPEEESQDKDRDVKNMYAMFMHADWERKAILDAYNCMRASLPGKLHESYTKGFDHGIVFGSVTTAVLTTAFVCVLKYFKRIQ